MVLLCDTVGILVDSISVFYSFVTDPKLIVAWGVSDHSIFVLRGRSYDQSFGLGSLQLSLLLVKVLMPQLENIVVAFDLRVGHDLGTIDFLNNFVLRNMDFPELCLMFVQCLIPLLDLNDFIRIRDHFTKFLLVNKLLALNDLLLIKGVIFRKMLSHFIFFNRPIDKLIHHVFYILNFGIVH